MILNKKFLLTILLSFFTATAFCHSVDLTRVALHEWSVNKNTKVSASFLMFKNNEVYLEKDNAEVVHFPLTSFSQTDQQYLQPRINRIQKLNSENATSYKRSVTTINVIDYEKIIVLTAMLFTILLLTYFFAGKNKFKYISYFSSVAVLAVLYSFKVNPLTLTTSITDPLSVDSAFVPFKPNVVTSWDANYFYVESFGIPTTHNMMIGITNWQQQVPIPQCYIKPNAWMIPLNPTLAAVPVPVSPSHFTRGAIAVAVNGIAIFNPYTNTGADAFLTGQLDQWGGHCGRADDYHYHIAPMQLYNNTSNTLPIAYALDGFSVYGNYEPDGTLMLPLDTNNGHFGTNGVYHYHGVAAAPYMIGNMVGQVTEDTTHQIIPQPNAHPIRPSLTPLNGAVITNFAANGSIGYTLTYTVSGNTDSIVYSWNAAGLYTFNFYNSGVLTTNTYNGFVQCLLPTSINNLYNDSKNVEVFPNPSRNEFSLQLNNSIQPTEIKNISIISDKGQLLYSTNTYQDKFSTNDFSKGIYFVIIKTSDNILTKKLVLQ